MNTCYGFTTGIYQQWTMVKQWQQSQTTIAATPGTHTATNNQQQQQRRRRLPQQGQQQQQQQQRQQQQQQQTTAQVCQISLDALKE